MKEKKKKESKTTGEVIKGRRWTSTKDEMAQLLDSFLSSTDS